jgi:hypothetical protein
MQPDSLTCEVCQALTPNHQPATRWQFNVADNLLIECVLPFDCASLEISGKNCIFCSVVKDGIAAMSQGSFRRQLEGLSDQKSCFIVQQDAPLEVEISGVGGNGEDSVRMQFFFDAGM